MCSRLSATPSSSASPEAALTIVSGGQTGVDRGALDGARDAGLPQGGWCPRGRRAEDGVIPCCYPLRETDLVDYAERTGRNVRDSEGTVLLTFGPLAGGSALTQTLAEEAGRPLLLLDARALSVSVAQRRLLRFVTEHGIHRLNVAGPRESEAPGAQAWARRLILGLGRDLDATDDPRKKSPGDNGKEQR
ncbi:MAG: putative molybdenum carrier protein [Pseudomonadota bacterium]